MVIVPRAIVRFNEKRGGGVGVEWGCTEEGRGGWEAAGFVIALRGDGPICRSLQSIYWLLLLLTAPVLVGG